MYLQAISNIVVTDYSSNVARFIKLSHNGDNVYLTQMTRMMMRMAVGETIIYQMIKIL